MTTRAILRRPHLPSQQQLRNVSETFLDVSCVVLPSQFVAAEINSSSVREQ
jgi:hypothetical protein